MEGQGGKPRDRRLALAMGCGAPIAVAALALVALFVATRKGPNGERREEPQHVFDPSLLPPREAVPVAAPGVSADDEVARDLSEALLRANVRQPLLRLFERGGETIYGLSVHGSAAVPTWRRIRAVTDETGYYPVLLGDGDDVGFTREIAEEAPPPPSIVRVASSLDVESWLDRRLRDGLWPLPSGEWPTEPTGDGDEIYTIPTDVLHGTPLEHVAIGLVPTTRPWEVPAWLGYGDWNACPAAEEHVAIMKRWHERYGAEVVGMAAATVEMRVTHPPTSRTSALALAREQYAYCEDIVLQGTGDLEHLAHDIQNQGSWYFWWD